MAVAVVFLPLLAAAIAGFLGRAIGDRLSQIVTCGALLLSMALGIVLFREILEQSGPHVVPIASWITAGGLDIEWALRLDTPFLDRPYLNSEPKAALATIHALFSESERLIH